MIEINKFEIQKAKYHFEDIEIDSVYDFDSNINDLIKYLQTNGFTFNDVIEFYSMSDLQDEYDICRLQKFLSTVEGSENLTSYMKILAEKGNKYLVIDNEY